jgi:hypothetical protein
MVRGDDDVLVENNVVLLEENVLFFEDHVIVLEELVVFREELVVVLDASVVGRLASDVFVVAHDRVVEDDDVVLEDDVGCLEQLDGCLEDNVLVLEAKAGLLSATSGLLTELLGLATLPTHRDTKLRICRTDFFRGLSFSANRVNQPARRSVSMAPGLEHPADRYSIGTIHKSNDAVAPGHCVGSATRYMRRGDVSKPTAPAKHPLASPASVSTAAADAFWANHCP